MTIKGKQNNFYISSAIDAHPLNLGLLSTSGALILAGKMGASCPTTTSRKSRLSILWSGYVAGYKSSFRPSRVRLSPNHLTLSSMSRLNSLPSRSTASHLHWQGARGRSHTFWLKESTLHLACVAACRSSSRLEDGHTLSDWRSWLSILLAWWHADFPQDPHGWDNCSQTSIIWYPRSLFCLLSS